jgi:hypothetical protein
MTDLERHHQQPIMRPRGWGRDGPWASYVQVVLEVISPRCTLGSRQRYCLAPRCRAASKAASQARWLAAPENRDYFRGPVNVARVREWWALPCSGLAGIGRAGTMASSSRPSSQCTRRLLTRSRISRAALRGGRATPLLGATSSCEVIHNLMAGNGFEREFWMGGVKWRLAGILRTELRDSLHIQLSLIRRAAMANRAAVICF